MRLLTAAIFLLIVSISTATLVAASPNDFYNKLFETNNPISDSDLDLIRRSSSLAKEWNNTTAEILRGYRQIISSQITPDEFIRKYSFAYNNLLIILPKMRLSAYAIDNPKIAEWHQNLYSIHEEMAKAYLDFKTSIEQGAYTEADNAIVRLRLASEKKARYIAGYANRLRQLAGDKEFDKILNQEVSGNLNRVFN